MVEETAQPLTARDRFPILRRALGALVLALAACATVAPVLAQPGPSPVWSALAAQQQEILAPLRDRWNGLDAADRARWLGVAKRYPKMTPIGQKRVQTRMHKWAKLTPEQRAQARERYERMRQDRKSKELRKHWQEYQALPPEQRERATPRR